MNFAQYYKGNKLTFAKNYICLVFTILLKFWLDNHLFGPFYKDIFHQKHNQNITICLWAPREASPGLLARAKAVNNQLARWRTLTVDKNIFAAINRAHSNSYYEITQPYIISLYKWRHKYCVVLFSIAYSWTRDTGFGIILDGLYGM